MSAGSEAPSTVILGGGPAGLTAAVCLARRGLSYRLLEAGSELGAGLARVDPQLRLISPAGVSRLPGMTLPRSPTYLPFGEYLGHLRRYAEEQGVQATLGARVVKVEVVGPEGTAESERSRFRILYQEASGERDLEARFVINATGILSSPHLPAVFDVDASRLPWRHSRDLRRSDLAASRRLLVVGGGISAANALEDWLAVRRPGDEAWLSLRSPLKVVPKTLLGIDVHYWGWLPERLPVVSGAWRFFRRDPMLGYGLPRLLRRGDVERLPAVQTFAADHVLLEGGRRLQPDLVVFATGYRYTADHLGDLLRFGPDGRPRVCCGESVDTPGLFLLGLRFARTFASPYLRGFGNDAAAAARKIARRLRAA